MPRVVFHIGADGKTQGLYTDASAKLIPADAKIERISHVEPCNRVLRCWFHLLRAVFGEDGRVGRWLRTWKCRWRVNFGVIGGSVFERDAEGKRFANRQAAIEFEIPLAEVYLKERRIPC